MFIKINFADGPYALVLNRLRSIPQVVDPELVIR